jgi:hypothetical protein
MFAVEIYAAVRWFVFVEGKSRGKAARVFGLSRETIAKMCRYSAPPGYVRSKAPERPKLGPLVPVIDAIVYWKPAWAIAANASSSRCCG